MIKVWRKTLRFFGLVIPAMYIVLPQKFILWLLASISFVFLVLEDLRFPNPQLNQLLLKKASFLYREDERGRVSGMTLFMISWTFAVALFAKEVAIIATSFALVGDGSAEIVGIRYGKRRTIRHKTLEGSLACFISCVLLGAVLSIPLRIPFAVILGGAFFTTVGELLPFKVDDNLTLPIFTGIGVALLQIII
ncbi:MAG: diacylglycerol/polyprenol kinase family protein [bacterium]